MELFVTQRRKTSETKISTVIWNVDRLSEHWRRIAWLAEVSTVLARANRNIFNRRRTKNYTCNNAWEYVELLSCEVENAVIGMRTYAAAKTHNHIDGDDGNVLVLATIMIIIIISLCNWIQCYINFQIRECLWRSIIQR